MTSIDSFTALYQRHRELRAEANALNKAVLFDALAAAGITAVIVDFDGEGDSGQIQGVAAQADGSSRALPEALVSIRTVSWGRDAVCSVRECPLTEAIEELCYGYLAQEHDGWENNDGAYGEFHIDVSARTIALDFNARYTDVYNSTYSW